MGGAEKKRPGFPGRRLNRRFVCYSAHVQVSHLQQLHVSHVQVSHVQQLLHFSCACAVSAVPIRATVISSAIRIVFIVFLLFRFKRFVNTIGYFKPQWADAGEGGLFVMCATGRRRKFGQ